MSGRHVLIIGIAPNAVDFSDPDLPPGADADTIAAGLHEAQRLFAEQGDACDLCLLDLKGPPEAPIAAQLASRPYDCIVIGGIRIPKANLELFEAVVNAVHRHAPVVPIAFNTAPANSVEAAGRWMGQGRVTPGG
ncbi:hypothetical protein HL653_08220 [Sphingomonas sp. AP4-R1]|uniref:hypothetical protein n=1 Tax=Sphingomonas sp. AP4-R1 TaxID=2735134 RepID=UPI0014936558|nr:hypothetical protein [Sphingomonas sp. AP4-R1]QJU57775.1 hypothetical protein HL653_08220 [Sphingomonas sp. AP4-R1]